MKPLKTFNEVSRIKNITITNTNVSGTILHQQFEINFFSQQNVILLMAFEFEYFYLFLDSSRHPLVQTWDIQEIKICPQS